MHDAHYKVDQLKPKSSLCLLGLRMKCRQLLGAPGIMRTVSAILLGL
jgi:hypothetical protein